MMHLKTLAFIAIGGATLSLTACAPAPEPEPEPPHPAEVACLEAVRGVGGSGATVTSRDTNETGSVVMLSDGTTSWSCRSANDGFVESLTQL